MDTVFFIPEQRTGLPGDAMSGDLMNSATKPIKRPLLEAGSAANADQLEESTATIAQTKGIESTGAWDAYDVWRRFIKEARDRRKGPTDN
jgi:trans-2-enoyl-CoA reductase